MLLGLNRDLFFAIACTSCEDVRTNICLKAEFINAKLAVASHDFSLHSQAREACAVGFVTYVGEFWAASVKF